MTCDDTGQECARFVEAKQDKLDRALAQNLSKHPHLTSILLHAMIGHNPLEESKYPLVN
jgi:hypothetical protein